MADHNIHELLSQCLAALAGLFGGLSVSFFWQPKKFINMADWRQA